MEQPTAAGTRRQDALGLLTFVALGLPDGMLGTAWPSMRQSVHAGVGALGLVLVAYTVGAVAVTVVVGRLIRRRGVAQVLALSSAVAVGAAALIASAPVLAAVIAAGLAFGLAGGAMDSGLNAAVGASGRNRLLNLLHGFYGVGTMVGPLVVTAAIVAGSWRAGYLVLIALDAVLVVLWLAARPPRPPAVSPGGESGAVSPAGRPPAVSTAGRPPAVSTAGQPPAVSTESGPSAEPPRDQRRPGLRRGPVAAGLAVFFVYTGLEVAAGQWEATFARGELRLSASAAGLATFGYWGALAAVRLGLGSFRRRPGPGTVLRTGTAAAVLATAVIWWRPSAAAAVTGFVVLGGALAGVFPSLVALTPPRVGDSDAARVIAWQIGAATAGGAALSALLGLLIQGSGLGVVGPGLTAMAVLLLGGELLLRRSSDRTNVRASA